MVSQFAFLDLSTPDLLIILAIVLLLFGAKKLPELARGLGSSARELRKGLSGDEAKSKEEASAKTSES
ncbi:MAG TPA: twin-arginine translocase TatA/TatE family subunit [Candidatus Saccharimonadales bacterium]|nr:twin-arginine translocase TatA/TatE family subunit [Candidatus Saccharimonadales bacterium]